MAIWPRFQTGKYRNDDRREETLHFITYEKGSSRFTFDPPDFLVEINDHVTQINFTLLIQFDLMIVDKKRTIQTIHDHMIDKVFEFALLIQFEPIESRDH